ncbi:MAG: ABC transporter permease subunit [Candidatus Eisenbacteria bacterium]|nr:ABC transporter permease subunit [Candidatus Eisenbacteria bacterium]
MTAALIAQNTYREATRDRVLAGMVVAGIALLVVTQIAAPLALGEGTRLTVDLGLSGISMIGLLVVLLVGTSLVAKELERRTIYNLLSRPIGRSSYLVGKWAGLSAALWTVAVVLGVALGCALALRGAHGRMVAVAEATYLAGLELSVVSALAVLFSSLSTPVLSALYTFALYLVGQWSYDLRELAANYPEPLAGLMRGAANVAPNLPLFNMRSLAAAGQPTSPLHLTIATGYALVYVSCVLCLATAAFESKDFK